MTRILLMAAVLALAPTVTPSAVHAQTVAASPGQVKDELFAGTEMFAKGATEVTEVNMDPQTLAMMPKDGSKGDLARKMDFIVVHSYTYDKPGMYRMEDMDTFRARLNAGNWNCIVHTRSKDESADICVRTSADKETNELVVMTSEPKELTFVHMKGRMSIEELQKAGAAAAPAPLKKR